VRHMQAMYINVKDTLRPLLLYHDGAFVRSIRVPRDASVRSIHPYGSCVYIDFEIIMA
jgi:hypothetical protein